MATLRERMAVRDELLATLANAGEERDQRWEMVDGPYGRQFGWVVYEAEELLAVVNRVRAERGLPSVEVYDVLRIEQGCSGHVDYADKYALRCAFLALGEGGSDARS